METITHDLIILGSGLAMGIQLLKRTLTLDALGLHRAKSAPKVVPLPTAFKASEKIPQPPARTVKSRRSMWNDKPFPRQNKVFTASR